MIHNISASRASLRDSALIVIVIVNGQIEEFGVAGGRAVTRVVHLGPYPGNRLGSIEGSSESLAVRLDVIGR